MGFNLRYDVHNMVVSGNRNRSFSLTQVRGHAVMTSSSATANDIEEIQRFLKDLQVTCSAYFKSIVYFYMII